MTAILWFIIAAIGEITGCFAFWMWLRLNKGPWALAFGLPALLLFAFALTKIDAPLAGRIYATYSAIYLLASLIWMATVEHVFPDRWDIIGTTVCLAGAAIILFAPR